MWKAIKEYECYYEISDKGEVRSVDRYIHDSSGKSRLLHGKVMKLTERRGKNRSEGYYVLNLRKNRTSWVVPVHRLVAAAFIPNPNGLPTINHIDGNKHNNTVENLEWATFSENNFHALRSGLRSPRGNSIMQFDLHGNLISTYRSTCEASRDTGISRGGISHCLNGRTLTSGGFVWKKLSESATTIPQGSTQEDELPVEAQRPSDMTEDIVCSVSNNGQNDNHSIAYCLLGYLCAYFRHYYPYEFITSFLNNAANDEDIRNGTAYANKVGIKVTMPKWGLSKGEYFFDKERNIIAKGLSSIKYMSESVAEELYQLAHTALYDHFVDLLRDLSTTSIDTRQLDILVKLDFFSDFGNQRELLRIIDLFKEFKNGEAKKISREKVDGTLLEPIISKYAIGETKSGGIAKSYTLLDVHSILREAEETIKSIHMEDLSDLTKVRNFADVMGYVGYVSGREEDRRKLYVTDIYPLHRKKDNFQFGYSVLTKSIGSGVEGRFTVVNRIYDSNPIKKGDIIWCKQFERDGTYYKLTGYERIY